MEGEAAKSQGKPIAALCYLLGFVTGILFLYMEPYSKDDFIRFHARQSIVFSVAWFAIIVVFGVFIAILPPSLGWVLAVIRGVIDFVLAIFWLFLMYKAYIGERYRIPQISDWSDSLPI